MCEVLDGFEGGLQMGGRGVTNLRYANDIILIVCSVMELQTLLDRLDNACKRYGLQINADKTKVMTTAEATCSISCGNSILEKVDMYAYLGSLITMDGECDKEIRSRLAKGYA